MGGEIDRTTGLVGRDREVVLLQRAVDDAVEGRARAVLIAGEPGIGKSALAEEAAAYATRAGARALWGQCWEGEGAPAFWPWVQIIRSYAADRRTDDLYTEMGDGAADVARLVPEVGGRFLSLTPPGDSDPDQARFRLFDHVSRFLRAAAEAQPLVLVFDDLHWADRSSLMLLRFFAQAARGARVLVLCTYRDVELTPDHPLREAVTDLPGERIALRGLGRDDVATLIRDTTGSEPAAGLAEAVFGKTTGNPFFVKEVARLLDAQGRLDSGASGAYAIPEGVRDVVRRRLAHLRQETVELLGAASVLGPDFDVDLVGRMTSHARGDVLDLLEGALAARVVAEQPDAVGRYAFAHALVRDVLYGDLGAATRAALHWRAGELLEQKHRGSAHVSEVALHLVKGAAAGDPAKAAGVAISAARLAIGMYAWDQAADLFQRALDAHALAGPSDALRVQTMLELGEARTRSGDLAAARRTFEEAAELAAGLGMSGELAHAALGLGGGLGGFEVRLFDDRQLDLLARALAMQPSEDSAARAWLLARLSVASSFVRPIEERASLASEAIEIARRLGDRGALAYALSSLCDALSGPDHVAGRLAASTEMVELSTQPADGAAQCGIESCTTCLCDPDFALLGRRLRIVANLERGDVVAVDADIEPYARLSEHLRQPLYRWYNPLFRGMRAMMRGNLDEAERQLADVSALAGRTSSENADVLARVQRAGLALERDDPVSAEAEWRAIIGDVPDLAKFPSYEAVAMMIECLFGDETRARELMSGWVRRGGLTTTEKDSEWLSAAAYAADGAIRLRHRAAAEHLYDVLLPYEDLFVVEAIAVRLMGSVAHYLGRLAALAGRPEEAERHLEQAIAAHEAVGAVLWAERSRAELAQVRGTPARASSPEAPPGEGVLRREGEFWTIAFDGAVTRLKDSKGLRDIAVLLAVPGREVAALDLIAADAGTPTRVEGDAGEMLDDRARSEYKTRIAELQSEIDDPGADPGRAERAREELAALAAQLSSAYGLGGRARKAGDPAERARKAVTERIREAIGKLARSNPTLHRHLKASIRTGTFCSYAPERPVTWSF